MQPDYLNDLLTAGSAPLGPAIGSIETGHRVGQVIRQLLSKKNGFYAFESALLVRPLTFSGAPLGLLEWNDLGYWKQFYTIDLSEDIFFAEDVFGEQFSLRPDGIFKFNPETAISEFFSDDIRGWAGKIMEDYSLHTGYQLAHLWQLKYGQLAAGYRLVPKMPFVLGGEYQIENLTLRSDLQGIEFRSQIANQIVDLPDGAQVEFKLIE